MKLNHWQQQTKAAPLFPQLLWSRPENRLAAGKLLIIGGNLHGFSAVALAHNIATAAGAGTVRVLLPDALKKTVGKVLENCDFAPSTHSGGFAQNALADLLDQAAWADAVLLAGDFGRSSETAVLLEKFLAKYRRPVIITKDTIDCFLNTPKTLLDRPNTTVVALMGQLQKLAQADHTTQAIASHMDLIRLAEAISVFSSGRQFGLITNHLGSLLVALNGQVSSTKTDLSDQLWQVETASKAAVVWLQNPQKPFEALTTAMII